MEPHLQREQPSPGDSGLSVLVKVGLFVVVPALLFYLISKFVG